MYTWGYIKENTLSKLNLSEEAANQQDFLSRFPYYANEAMTQICSIKPNPQFLNVTVYDRKVVWDITTKHYNLYIGTNPENVVRPDVITDDKEKEFWDEIDSYNYFETPIEFPDDFIRFGNDVARVRDGYTGQWREAVDAGVAADITYKGYNKIVFHRIGNNSEFEIPYDARWFFFTKELKNGDIVTAPADICDAIPSYIASQCYKIDDEEKSSIYRNEYEMFLARIDDTNFESQRTFSIGGDW